MSLYCEHHTDELGNVVTADTIMEFIQMYRDRVRRKSGNTSVAISLLNGHLYDIYDLDRIQRLTILKSRL